MEVKERYEVMIPSLNGYAYIHDFITDNVLNTYDSCDLLNQQSKRIKELEKENEQLKQQLKDTEESYNNTMRYLNKTRSELLNLHKKIQEVEVFMVIDRELERRVYNLYTYIDKYVNKHSVDAVDVYNEMLNVLTYIIWRQLW